MILATPHTLFVAHMLSHGLARAGFRTSLITAAPPMGYGSDVYIVICAQMFSKLPANMIAFQMEQSISPRWFTESYLGRLRAALAVLDYSRTNIEFLTRAGIPYGNIFYLPIAPVPGYLEFLAAAGIHLDRATPKTCDVLFYGDVNNERRRMILGRLRERFDVMVVSNLFGQKLYEKMMAARVVVNIHYYENALLETTRICECLSLGLPVVSETSSDRGEYAELESRVRFVDVGDTAAMIEAIQGILDASESHPVDQEDTPSQEVGLSGTASSFYLNRFLLAFGLTELQAFANGAALPPRFSTGKICLSLPETAARRASFLSQGLPGYEIFDGLRNAQGWIGCAMSYKYLLQRAKDAGLPRLLICEDDVVLAPDGMSALSVVERYLDSLNGEWDIFVGLISSVHPDVTVSRVDVFEGTTFAHIDRMTGMVLNIYNRSAYDLLIAWDESNEDPRTNTIDRYLESRKNLRVVTALPFIAGHSEDDHSTLWGIGNERYVDLIARSQDQLLEKVRAF
ncbi:hypothetical protein ACPWT1_04740 [Ramlibacter sp. MMS24-I3-19]|uniref:hypothetical protein n=1 Tax=Ramlibacter sp. MMS24-I3-19 TaxID=3416606 RepID=UPI003CFC6B64